MCGFVGVWKVGRSVLAEPQSVVRHMVVHRVSFGLMMGFLVAIYGRGSPGTVRPTVLGCARGSQKPQHVVVQVEALGKHRRR